MKRSLVAGEANVYLIVCPLDGRNIHVVGGGAHIFILLVGEDVDTNQVNLQGEEHSKRATGGKNQAAKKQLNP